MAYCKNCKLEYGEEVRFCTECGAVLEPGSIPAEETAGSENTYYTEPEYKAEPTQGTPSGAGFESKVTDAFNKFNNTNDETASLDATDIEQNKIMGVLAYCSWLILIPIFAAKGSKFARFHCNQGIVLAVTELVLIIVSSLILGITGGFLYTFFSIIFDIVWAVCGIMSIIGLVNAIQGKAKELPLIGKYRILK